jgi:cell wall-associated NlpC family hydrolase
MAGPGAGADRPNAARAAGPLGRPAGAIGARPGPAALLTPLATAEAPAQRIARLRAEAAKVQRTIEQMNNQVEVLVERYNANREALARTQESLRVRLERDRRQIEGQLASQRAYLARVTAAVRRAVEEERRRQEELRRQALARRLAALRAARLRARRGLPVDGRTVTGRAVAFALAQLGKPYQWGATGPGRYDCSGLTQTAYRYAGLLIPRVSADQWRAGPHVGLGDLRPGDLVFYASDVLDPTTIHHVGMYIGRGLMVEAPFTGAVVRTSSIGRPDYIGATRPTG